MIERHLFVDALEQLDRPEALAEIKQFLVEMMYLYEQSDEEEIIVKAYEAFPD